jgi:hypothetical protein
LISVQLLLGSLNLPIEALLVIEEQSQIQVTRAQLPRASMTAARKRRQE